ncbi:MAG: PEP/pyruvate-binding domain-containing protein [Nanoarchaeota archaeon]
MSSIISLHEANMHKPPKVGHAARKLSELIQARLPVPDGVVLTSQVFKEFLIESSIKERFFSLIREKQMVQLQKLVKERKFPSYLEEELINEIHHVKKNGFSARVSTVFSEEYDSKNLAEEQLVEGVKRAWASIYTPQRAAHLNAYNMFPAVIVQPAVHETKYGQLFTINPLTNSKEKMIIEVQSPKHYFFLVNKEDYSVVNEKDFFTINSPLFIKEKDNLCEIGERVGQYFEKPQKIRWVFGKTGYLVSSEDITPEDKSYFIKLAQVNEHVR